jgi:hypothetical protein
METTFEWKPQLTLLEQVLTLAQQSGRTPEAIITEAVMLYLETQIKESGVAQPSHDIQQSDPLIGLFSGSPDLASQSEEILQQEITTDSGWTWKLPSQ